MIVASGKSLDRLGTFIECPHCKGMGQIDVTVLAAARPGADRAGLLTGGELWEFLFGAMDGAVPEELTNDILDRLAAHIKEHLLPTKEFR